MRNAADHQREAIPEQVMLARIAQSEQMREFFIQMWLQNPALAKQGGARVQNLLTPLDRVEPDANAAAPSRASAVKQRGISLIELIIFIVIISTALTGILLVMNQVTRNSADPLLRKQALAAAESLLEEIELQDFSPVPGEVATPVTQANRASLYHVVGDYAGYKSTTFGGGIFPVSGVTAIAGLEGYGVTVAVASASGVAAWNGIPAGSAVLITVTVTTPQGEAIPISGYRTAY